MKHLFLLFIITISFSFSTDAQWHLRRCDVSDINICTPSEFECLWRNASNNVLGGAITTVFGTACVIGGIRLVTKETVPGDIGPGMIGAYIVIPTGVIMNIVGISSWVVGANRKSQLRKTSNYQSLNPVSLKLLHSININQFNNICSYRITATLSF